MTHILENAAAEVFCRVLPIELPESQKAIFETTQKTVELKEGENGVLYKFSEVFGTGSTADEVFKKVGLSFVNRLINGQNSLLMFSEASGSGHCSSMTGGPQNDGILPKFVEFFFNLISRNQVLNHFVGNNVNGFEVKRENVDSAASCFITFNLFHGINIFDVNDSAKEGLPQKWLNYSRNTQSMFVQNAKEVEVGTPGDVLDLVWKGQQRAYKYCPKEAQAGHFVLSLRLVQESKPLNSNAVENNIKISQTYFVNLARSDEGAPATEKDFKALRECLHLLRGSKGNAMGPCSSSQFISLFNDYFTGNAAVRLLCSINESSDITETKKQLCFAESSWSRMDAAETIKKVMLQNQLINLERKLKEKEEALYKFERDIAIKSDNEVSDLEKRLKGSEEEVHRLKAEIKNILKEKEEAVKRELDLKAKLETYIGLEGKLTEIKKQMESLKANNEKILKDKEQIVKMHKQELTAKLERVEELKGKLTVREIQIDRMKANNERILKEKNEHVKALQLDLKAKMEREIEMQEKATEREIMMDRLNTKNEKILKEKNKKIKNLERDLKAMVEKWDELQKKLKGFEKQENWQKAGIEESQKKESCIKVGNLNASIGDLSKNISPKAKALKNRALTVSIAKVSVGTISKENDEGFNPRICHVVSLQDNSSFDDNENHLSIKKAKRIRVLTVEELSSLDGQVSATKNGNKELAQESSMTLGNESSMATEEACAENLPYVPVCSDVSDEDSEVRKTEKQKKRTLRSSQAAVKKARNEKIEDKMKANKTYAKNRSKAILKSRSSGAQEDIPLAQLLRSTKS